MVALFPGGKDFTAVFAEHPVLRHTTAEVVADIEAKAAAKAAKAAKAAEPSAEHEAKLADEVRA